MNSYGIISCVIGALILVGGYLLYAGLVDPEEHGYKEIRDDVRGSSATTSVDGESPHRGSESVEPIPTDPFSNKKASEADLRSSLEIALAENKRLAADLKSIREELLALKSLEKERYWTSVHYERLRDFVAEKFVGVHPQVLSIIDDSSSHEFLRLARNVSSDIASFIAIYGSEPSEVQVQSLITIGRLRAKAGKKQRRYLALKDGASKKDGNAEAKRSATRIAEALSDWKAVLDECFSFSRTHFSDDMTVALLGELEPKFH